MQATSPDTVSLERLGPRAPAVSSPNERPIAPLRVRAFTAYQNERDQMKDRERLRREQEALRQRDELLHLMQAILGECLSPEAATVSPDMGAMVPVEVTVAVDDLRFRVHAHPDGGDSLEVLLECRACRDTCWHIVAGLGGLGLLLSQAQDGSLANDCPTCHLLRTLEDDPFHNQ